MNKTEMRGIAIGAVRSQARAMHIDPVTCSAEDALAILDDIARCERALVASLWYAEASDAQIQAFKREWRAWREEQRGMV